MARGKKHQVVTPFYINSFATTWQENTFPLGCVASLIPHIWIVIKKWNQFLSKCE